MTLKLLINNQVIVCITIIILTDLQFLPNVNAMCESNAFPLIYVMKIHYS